LIVNIKDWFESYTKLYNSVDLNGLWIAPYGSHGEEIISVEQKGYHILATKVTGIRNQIQIKNDKGM
jgi:hypothetical protein